MSEAKQYQTRNGTSYDARTPPAVIDALEAARAAGRNVRVFLGETSTGRAWPEEWDVFGSIGRSCGSVKIPLLVAPRSNGGPGLLDHCIVAIMTAPGVFAYRHPTFDVGAWSIAAPSADLVAHGYVEAVQHDGQNAANFKKRGQAARYVAFMRGERMAR